MVELDLSGSKSGGIQVAYAGSDKDVIVSGGLENADEGYSAKILITLAGATEKPADISVSSVGLMNGVPDPMMMFPAGTRFHTYLAMRNIGVRATAVTPTLYYMEGQPLKPLCCQLCG